MTRYRFLTISLIFALTAASIMVAASDVPDNNGAIPQRSDIEDKYKWKVEDMYATIDAWESDYKLLEQSLPALEKYRGHLGDSPETMLEALRLRDSLSIIDGNLYVFANLKLSEDTRRSDIQELSGRIATLDGKLGEATAYFEPEILAMDQAVIDKFLVQNKDLNLYKFYLENQMRQKAHILSTQEEELMAMAGPVLGTPIKLFGMIDNADHKLGSILDKDGNKIDLTYGRYGKILRETDRDMRRIANDTVQSSWIRYVNTLAANLNFQIDKDLFITKARKYNSTLERSLDANNIPTSVYHNLIDAVNANLPAIQKWYSLRKKVLGYDSLFTYDMVVPMVPEYEKKYSYEEARAIVTEGLKPLGSKYVANLKMGFSSGWVDAFETEGKETGGYNWGTYTSHPYIMMNYDSTLGEVFTLAHEMGHALHAYYTNRKEPYIYYGHSLFTAEVASTCNEAILMKYMITNAKSNEEKIMLLNQYISQIEGTFITQVMFSEYELMLHEHIQNGGALSVDFVRETYRKLLEKYWGPDVIIGENNDMGALKLYHFYRTYYVYQYATSYAAAQMLSQKILEGDQKALDAYMKFLTVGSSKYPMDVLKDAGVDMTSSEPVDRTLKLFSKLIDEMEQLLDQM